MTVAVSNGTQEPFRRPSESLRRRRSSLSASTSTSTSAKRSNVVSVEEPAKDGTPTDSPGPSSLHDAPRRVLTPKSSRRRKFASDASLVLVGIRGCGKRSLGFIAATALGRRFVTEDHYFQKVTGLSRQDYLREHGKAVFHKAETEVSIRMLNENDSRCVIECGFASLTRNVQDHLREYTLTHPVIYLTRDMAQIENLLKLDHRTAKLLGNGDQTHRRCSNYEYFNLEEASGPGEVDNEDVDRRSPNYSFKLRESQEDFSYFVRLVCGVMPAQHAVESPFSLTATAVEKRLFTHNLELRLSEYTESSINFSELESAGDVAEIIVDRWDRSAASLLSKFVAEVRRKITVPIIVSTSLQILQASPAAHLEVLEHGLRLAAEFVAVDLRLDDKEIALLIGSKGGTRIIGSYCADGTQPPVSWNQSEWMHRYTTAQALGCDIVRLVQPAISRDDNDGLFAFMQKVAASVDPGIPVIAFNTGFFGRTSQIFNKILTAVTHPCLDSIRALDSSDSKPQLTSRQATQSLFSSFMLDPLTFYVLGANVSASVSPGMHNAAHRLLGTQHIYKTQDISSVADFEKIARDHNFGGASIGQPWKVRLINQLAALSSHAKAIGAVNTILPLRRRADGTVLPPSEQANQRNRAGPVAAWYGDNTDWIGVTVCMGRNLSPRNVVQPLKTTALIVGAGGVARAAVYAVMLMGCRNVFVYNRTFSHAEILAQHFNRTATSSAATAEASPVIVRTLRSADGPWPVGYAMPTMIISCVGQEIMPGRQPVDITVPPQWLQSKTGGVVMEMSYTTRTTALNTQIVQVRAETRVPWVFVDGFETLVEQGIAQFELMAGRKAPKRCIREAIVMAAHATDSSGS